MSNSNPSFIYRTRYQNAIKQQPISTRINTSANRPYIQSDMESFSSIHSNSRKSKLRLTNKFFRVFISVSLIFILIGIIFLCICITYKMIYNNNSCQTIEGESWSNWSSWSECNQTSSLASRQRICLLSNKCTGSNEDFIKCKNIYQPENKFIGLWSSWSQWSACSHHCKTKNQIPIQYRNRTCMDNNKEIHSCIGYKSEYNFCSWLIDCPQTQWSEWILSEFCVLRGKTPCGPGHQTANRKCILNNCTKSESQIIDCWSYIGCPVNLQPPINVELISDGKGIFKIFFSIVPYGEIAKKVWIYLTRVNNSGKEMKTFVQEVTVNHDKTAIKNHDITVNCTQYLAMKYFHTLVIRLSSVDINENKSILTDPVSSVVTAVDGQWETWSNWGSCSSECFNESGKRIRTRLCNNPAPSNNGKPCLGLSENSVSCRGLDMKIC